MPRRNRLYFTSSENSSETTANQNEWQRFPYPSGGYNIIRHDGGDLTLDNTMTRITYTGEKPIWILTFAQCNLLKGSGGNTDRDVSFCWYKNGSQYGDIRKCHMNNKDSEIISGFGYMLLEQNDFVEPFLANTENEDKCLLSSCSFLLIEDMGY